ncbi:MAG TPA: C40 family peptidase [Burkholderiales bacterium]|jgi:cell wall-associated NlpC family hydrolase
MPVKRLSTVLPIGLFFFVVAGCASAPHPAERAASGVGDRAAQNAAQLVGKPYHYGGASPSTGFDCSGLVQWSYAQAGRKLPRSTDDQRAAGGRIKVSELRRGDLIFFDQEGKKNSHVGIYVGNGEFVHAPSSGKRVRRDRLDAPYWHKHISEARRLNV